MAFNYTDMATMATELLGESGKASAILRVKGTTSTDPVAGTVTRAADADTACEAVATQYNERYNTGAIIQDGDQFLVINVAASPGHYLVISGTEFRIVQSWPIKPGDTLVACRVQVRP